MRIDVHAHYWPGAYLDRLTEAGRPDLARAGRQADDFDQRVATLDANGVQLQLLSAIGLNVELSDPAASAAATRLLNDIYVDIARRYPGRFAPLASVGLPHVEQATVETERAFGELNAAGVALPCIVGGKPIDHEDYEPFWANLARHDAVVFVHPAGSDSEGHPGMDRFGMQFAFGSAAQIGIAPIRILLSGLSTRYPTLRFVFAMCGGFMPFIHPRLDRNLRRGFEQSAKAAVGNHFFDWVKALPVDPAEPLAGLKRFWYDVSMQDVPSALMDVRDTYGVDRLVLGSDEIFASLSEAIAYVEKSEYLTDDEKRAVLDTNAESMLGKDLVKRLSTPS